MHELCNSVILYSTYAFLYGTTRKQYVYLTKRIVINYDELYVLSFDKPFKNSIHYIIRFRIMYVIFKHREVHPPFCITANSANMTLSMKFFFRNMAYGRYVQRPR